MTYIRSVTILTILAQLGALSQFASARPLSRTDAVVTALKANPDVQKSRENLALLKGRIKEAVADALPDVSFSGMATRYRDPGLLNSSSFDAFPPDLRESLKPVPANLFEGALLIRQTVWSFKIGKAIKAARFGDEMGREDVRRAENSTALAAVTAYNGYLLSLERVRVTENAVAQKEQHLETARNRRAAGVATDLDVLRSEVDLANERAQLERERGQANLARAALNAVMVRPIDERIEPTDTLAYEPFSAELEQVVHEAVTRRAELLGIKLGEKIYDQFVGIAQADFRPRVDFNAAWGYSVREAGNFFESDYQKWSASVTVSVPIFDGRRTSGRVEQAAAELQKTVQDRVAIENQIRLEANEAVDTLHVAERVLQAAQLNVAQAQKALDMVRANYSHGAATTLDVMDSQTALTLAESIHIQALHDHANARAMVRYVMGRDPLSNGTVDSPTPSVENKELRNE